MRLYARQPAGRLSAYVEGPRRLSAPLSASEPMPETVVHRADEHGFDEEVSRRQCGPGCQLIVQRCGCNLERRLRVIDGKIRTVEIRPRSGWQWFDVRELLTLELPYALCPNCAGDGCEACRGLGILERIPLTVGSR